MSDTTRPVSPVRWSVKAPIKVTVIAVATAITAACAPKIVPVPPPPPPPPPPPVVIPARPVPPGNAALGMYIPPRDQFGIRRTVNYGLTEAQTLWNLRSALNVAALNCETTRYPGILPAYSELLSENRTTLRRTNNELTREYRDRYGAEWRSAMDGYMTQVYNYYALPPTQTQFCDTAAQVAQDSTVVESADLPTFAAANLPRIEGVFDNFYTAYEQYQIDVAQWDAQYGAPAPIVTDFAPGTGPAPSVLVSTPESELYRIEVDPSSAGAAPVDAASPPNAGPQITGEPVFVAGQAGDPEPEQPENATEPVFVSGALENAPEGDDERIIDDGPVFMPPEDDASASPQNGTQFDLPPESE